jgi:hypothetical protein
MEKCYKKERITNGIKEFESFKDFLDFIGFLDMDAFQHIKRA